MIRIVCKLNHYTYGGTAYQRKQYKKARYRKREQREQNRIYKSFDGWLNKAIPHE